MPVKGVPLAMKASAASLISTISASEKGWVQRSGLDLYSSRSQAVGLGDCEWLLLM